MRESPKENSNYLKSYHLKQTPIPDGLVVIVDTREQESPLLKNHQKVWLLSAIH